MYFPQFLVGMFTTSGIVAVWAYMATGSIWKALAWTIIAAIVLQVGYFVLVVRLIYQRRTDEKTEANQDATQQQPVMPTSPLHKDGVSL
ncbi:exopolysaccharide production repressor protein [Mesorhizobium calcicola]|uniref:Exopolysaccharide production repressor protein n=1 Tax=Mesorhizobium calcicola TaxID=1300310 RepID=A0ABW4WAV6_9HYPH